MKNVYIVNSSYDYEQMFVRNGYAVVSNLHDADLICFTGGEDVTPSLYGEERHPFTFNSELRDNVEKRFFLDAVEKDIPCVGICRGGQFLNVMNGGKMYQHVTEHCGTHPATDVLTGEEIMVSSTHHQMMRPAEVGSEVVMIAEKGGSKEWMDGDKICVTFDTPDIECVWYPQTRSLCFQPHPEFSGFKPMTDYFFSLINRYIF